jgi:AraC family transcriptional regulator, regulatory protein of adaptative response / methylated-DNA-[protein]-cysteine methyltransferase
MTDYDRIEKVLRHLEINYLSQPSLKDLAKIAGVSEFHFQRLFGRWTGTTPKSFVQYLTAKHAKQLLIESKDVLTASLDSGLSGPSRLHDLMISAEAMTPGEFKAKGSGVEIRYGIHETPFGEALIGLTNRGVCHLSFIEKNKSDALEELKASWPKASFKSVKTETAKAIKTIFGKSSKGRISLLLRGTPFQIKVWEALLSVPEGAVVSYSNLAEIAGVPGASRAVGSAVGRNAIAYLIPCHRVIRETGAIGDYRWGAPRKRAVFAWEQARKEAKL